VIVKAAPISATPRKMINPHWAISTRFLLSNSLDDADIRLDDETEFLVDDDQRNIGIREIPAVRKTTGCLSRRHFLARERSIAGESLAAGTWRSRLCPSRSRPGCRFLRDLFREIVVDPASEK
jgi:hypothetical protein